MEVWNSDEAPLAGVYVRTMLMRTRTNDANIKISARLMKIISPADIFIH